MAINPNKRSKKSLGQNYLIDPNYQGKIISAIRKDYQGETIVEIGPGRGALTQHLVAFASELILVEKDNSLVKELEDLYGDRRNVRVLHGDFLKVNIEDIVGSLPSTVYRPIVVGNLPYNVSSQILIKLLQNNSLFKSLFFMFQKEVAIRCSAGPGGKDFGMLSIWTQLFSKPKMLFDVPPNAFKPRPRVNSSFVQFELIHKAYKEEQAFISFVKRLFSQRRKKIRNLIVDKKTKRTVLNDISDEMRDYLECRAETLSINELKEIHKMVLDL